MHEARQYQKERTCAVKCSLCNHRCTIAGRETRDLRGPAERRAGRCMPPRTACQCRSGGSDREKTALPLPARHPLVFAGRHRVQFPLRALPELAYLAGEFEMPACVRSPRKKGSPGHLQAGAQASHGHITSRPSGTSIHLTWARSPGHRDLGPCYVTNGYITEEALRELVPMLGGVPGGYQGVH